MIQTVIHFERKIATYVFLRNGVYYFQIRLKKDDRRRRFFKSGLIRKSLNTNNYREAVAKARLLWVHYLDQNHKDIIDTAEAIEADAQRQADMFSRGRELCNIYYTIHPADLNALDDFFTYEFGTSGYTEAFDREAFEYFDINYGKQNSSNSNNTNDDDISKQLQGISDQLSDRTKIPVNKDTTQRLSAAVKKFIERNQSSKNAWGYDQHNRYQQSLSFFIEQMEDCHIHQLTKDKIIDQYALVLQQYPADPTKKKLLKDATGKLYSTEKLLKLTQQHQLNTLSARTIQSKAGLVKTFIQSLSIDKYIRDTLMEAFKSIDGLNVINKRRKGFDDNEIQKIFNQKEFFDGLWFKKHQWRHWGLLLAIYTGARVNEICQLDVNDIKTDEETGIVYFNFTDLPDAEDKSDGLKSLKTKNAKRQVPIHRHLIKLGFLNFVKQQKQRKHKKLFHALTYTEKDRWSKKLKRWFNETYMLDKGIEKFVSDEFTTMSFHCFRSTVINFGKQNRMDRSIMKEIVGHAPDQNDIIHDNYATPYNLGNRQKEINKLSFGIEIDKIKKWM